MPVYITNSLTKKKEEFRPLKDKKVGIYTCGVTVYDSCHIGHARSLYVFDIIRRYLRYKGYKVRFIRNITDIDDKIINKAKELDKTAKEISEIYIKSYREDLRMLGIEEADEEPLATEHIQDMIKHISGLIKKGFAYIVSGDVYFSVKKFKDYGKLSGQNIEQMMTGIRIEPGEKKQDPLDFALWKRSKEGEPKWHSPWGEGRPGWHIECSVMSSKYLGETFDIHAGGRDLIFPHHENEIAQSEALTGKPFANYWIHHGLLTINGQKMAKSLGNFVTIKDFMDRYHDADILKLFFLSAHYSSPVDYNDESMKKARRQKINFDLFFDNTSTSMPNKLEVSNKDKSKIDDFFRKFEQALDDDFNTPEALACIFKLMDYASARESSFEYARAKMAVLFDILGLRVKPALNIPEDVSKIAKERYEKKKERDFKKADELRNYVKRLGYQINDTGKNYSLSAIPADE
jgi:cysteinyl-tRNA synthetase